VELSDPVDGDDARQRSGYQLIELGPDEPPGTADDWVVDLNPEYTDSTQSIRLGIVPGSSVALTRCAAHDFFGDGSASNWTLDGWSVRSDGGQPSFWTNDQGLLGRYRAWKSASGSDEYADLTGYAPATVDEVGHRIEIDYHAMNRTTEKRYPVPSESTVYKETNRYDAAGSRSAITDARSAGGAGDPRFQTTYVYDGIEYNALNRVVRKTEPTGSVNQAGPRAITTSTYDEAGNLLQVEDATGDTTTYQYDARNRRLSEKTAAGTRQYQYDPAGNLTSVVDRNARATHYEYNGLNKQVLEQWVNHQGKPIRTFTATYDAFGRRTSVAAGTVTNTFP